MMEKDARRLKTIPINSTVFTPILVQWNEHLIDRKHNQRNDSKEQFDIFETFAWFWSFKDHSQDKHKHCFFHWIF